MSGSAKWTFEFSTKRMELLKRLLKKEKVEASEEKGNTLALARIATRKDTDSLPLSFAQQRLWFLDQLDPSKPTYNIPIALRLRGILSVAALEQSLREIVRRHEALRTTFPNVDGNPVQCIAPSPDIPLQSMDLGHLSADEREQEAARLLTEEAQHPFDLSQGPLLRVLLLRLDETEHLLLLILHHIVADAWSMGVLTGELTTLYNAFRTGRPSPLPELSIQYADFAVWQRQWLQGEVLERQLAYWQQQLAGAPTVLQLPTSRPRPMIQTFQGAVHHFSLPLAVSEGLKELSRREGTTLFMTLLAAFQILLCRYTGQEDIVVGSPIANRMHAEIEKLIGFFVNTLVLRTDLSGNPTFQELLRRVREVALGAYSHQDVPFEQVVEAVQPERDLSWTPLFQVMFGLENIPESALEFAGVSLQPVQIEYGTAKFDVTLDLQETVQGLTGHVEYNTDLFEPATISRMAGHFQTLLEGIVTSPEQPISELPLLTEAERHQLIVEWNETRSDYPKDLCIHQLFEAQVERALDEVAVVLEEEQLTYRELNKKANQLAHYLQAQGVGPEVRVGICVERSMIMIVGVLGILKAGGAYVPLDPAYPRQRLTFMLEDTQMPVLLTQQHLVKELGLHEKKIICLDTAWKSIAQESEENTPSGTLPENLAYIIYTSGSTGKPKGVMISHESLVNAYMAWEARYQLRSFATCHLQMANFAFDVFTGDMVRALCSGGKLVFCPQELLSDPEQLYALICREQVNSAEFVPAVLRNMFLYLRENGLSLNFMRLLVVGSDIWYSKEHQNLREECGPGTRVINSYGVTEATIDSSYFEATLGKLEEDALAPIGRPFANTQIYILDAHLQPVPIGIPGELYVSGLGLSRGYLNRPELTAERFIPNPFSNEQSACLYKTGDLARYLPDGNIEFLGRADHLVKIRGFRIELGEIESVLREHPEVRECVVVAREDVPGNKRLVAYVILQLGQVSKSHELQHHLRERLPEYMVPSAFVELEALPLTTSGKIDRQALPTPNATRCEQEGDFIAPRNPVEEKLTDIWAQVLGSERVSIRDDFFELGGHSLLAVRLVTQIRKEFEQQLPLSAIFQGRTIETLATILGQHTNFSSWSPVVEIQRGDSKSPFFCIHPAGGNVLCYAELARQLGLSQPFYGLQSLGLEGEQEPFIKLEDMATYYIETLRTIQPQGPYLLGGWSFGGSVAFEIAQQLQKQGYEVALLALLDSWAPTSTNKFSADDTLLMDWFIKDIAFTEEHPGLDDNLRWLRVDDQLSSTLEWARNVNALPPDIGLLQMRQLFHVFKTNILSWLNYIPEVYPNRVTLFRAIEHPSGSPLDPYLGWKELTTGGVEIHPIPGDHYSIVRNPLTLAKLLRLCLDEVIRREIVEE